MKHLYKIVFLFAVCFWTTACSDTIYEQKINPDPTISHYYDVVALHLTDGKYATVEIPRTRLSAGRYKIIAFPKAMNLKSYYVEADAQGTIRLEYQLDKSFTIDEGYDGTVFGFLQISNMSRSAVLSVPVGYVEK